MPERRRPALVRRRQGWIAALVLALAGVAGADDYPGEEVPGTKTPIEIGDRVVGSPQRGYITFAPRKKGGPTPWNCLAHAKGHPGVWIQPGSGARTKPGGGAVQVATMQEILGDNGCTVVPCATPPEGTNCPPPQQLVWLIYSLPKAMPTPPEGTLPPDDYWLHAMRKTPEGWTSKDGAQERRDKIGDPYPVLDFYFLGTGDERKVIRCACCPIPGVTSTTSVGGPATTTTLQTGQAVRLGHTLAPGLQAGTDVCLARITGGHVGEHASGCEGRHLHAVDAGIMVDGGGPYPDPEPTGCGYGLIVSANCPG